MGDVTNWEHAFAAFAGLAVPIGAAWQQRALRRGEVVLTTREKVLTYAANSAALWLLAVGAIAAWRTGGGTLDGLGLTAAPSPLGGAVAAGAVCLALYAIDVVSEIGSPARRAATAARLRRAAPFLPADGREFAWSMVLVASASIAEEIVYRGFLVGYLARVFGGATAGNAAAILLPALVFAVAHGYQGRRAVVKIALLAAALGAIAAWTRSLWVPIAVHFAIDLTGALLAVRLLRTPA